MGRPSNRQTAANRGAHSAYVASNVSAQIFDENFHRISFTLTNPSTNTGRLFVKLGEAPALISPGGYDFYLDPGDTATPPPFYWIGKVQGILSIVGPEAIAVVEHT